MTVRTEVAEVLACFDGEFAEVAASFACGEYLLWLGSGISRDVVPGVPTLLERMLEFLRTSTDATDPTCRFQKALREVLDVAGVPDAVLASVDLDKPVDQWPALEDIVTRLVDKYSDVLDVQVQGESEDYLVWTGLNVPTTYGASGLVPDVEHLCVAILMLEGVVRSAPTTNWDGLVEAAIDSITEDPVGVLKVVVRAVDFREPDRQAELVKFHGCAVRAAADEDEYRNRLIARRSQISGWTTEPGNQFMKNRLEHLFGSRPAFIVGLSAQDADIHTILHQASRDLAREWPTSPPAVVFAEQQLHHHHKHVMKATYGDTYSRNADAIAESALLGAYAKPALMALVLFTLSDKLSKLVECVPEWSMPAGEIDRVRSGIRTLRDALGRMADADPRSFVDGVVSSMALMLSVFRKGLAPNPTSVRYQPISSAPIATALTGPDFPGAALGRLAVAASLLGRGVGEGSWSLEVGTPTRPEEGVVLIAARSRVSRAFVVRDSRALIQLEIDEVVDPDDEMVLVIQAEAARPPATRASRPRYGRTGIGRARHVDLEGLCATVSTADELFEAFRLEASL